MERTEYINGLRAVADFFEQNPGITVMPSPYLFANIWHSNHIDPKPILAAVAKGSGHAKKIYTETEFQVEVQIGCFLVRYDTPRELVCERVKVGERIIPAFTLPARAKAVLIPEKVEEVYEWKCPGSLLEATR